MSALHQTISSVPLAVVVFWVAAVLAVASAVLVVIGKNPVVCAVWLIFHFFVLAVLYLLLGSSFLAAVQVLVYAGAVMVLFLFVLMFLRVRTVVLEGGTHAFWALLAASFVLVALGAFAIKLIPRVQNGVDGCPGGVGTLMSISRELLSRNLFAFELISAILLAAVVGGVVIAKVMSKEGEE